MKVRMYAFFDKVAQMVLGDSNGIVLLKHDAVAIREFGVMCRRENSIFAQHPNDYQLMSLGEFDTETLVAEPWASGPALVCSAAQAIETTAVPE